MRRGIVWLGCVLLAAGCSDSKPDAVQSAGTPSVEEARTAIADYLQLCGWSNVELTEVAAASDLPEGARVPGEAWPFRFAASYTNVFGERQSRSDWLAVVARDGEQTRVTCCFDDERKMVAGSRGTDRAEVASLSPQ